jgi:hypothetical protein
MLFWIPDNTFWRDPGEFPYAAAPRWLYRLLAGQDFFDAPPAWITQYQRRAARLQRQQEEYDLYLQKLANYEAALAEYQDQGEEMAERLPYYLHNLRLSHWRRFQEKKEERYRDHVDYCVVEEWYFDEMAYFFWINTWDDFPYGITIKQFQEPEIADTLSVNFGSQVTVEVNARNHERPGLWIVVEHKAGRGLVPAWVNYTDMIKAIPKTAPPLVYPVGVGAHNKALFYDMDEIFTVLVVGQKGSGKSVFINSTLCTWLQRATPQDVRLFLTDLKGGVELYDYNGIPHLGGDVDHKMRLKKDGEPEMVRLGQQILEEPYQVVPVLKYMELEMSRRQQILKRSRVRKVSAYNKRHREKPLSRWVLVVDELATLADSEHRKEAYTSLAELVRKGRAAGIYCILATQVPDKTVLTRQIAGNMDFRLVGYLSDGPSSGIALGDGSYDATRLPPEVRGRRVCRWNKKEVVQAPFISDMTISRIVGAVKHGQQASADDAEEAALAQEIFTYALDELGGMCDNRELFAHFRNRIPKHKIHSILKAWEVSETPDGLWPIITLDDDEYYLLPSVKNGNRGQLPRQLMDTADFDQERENWLKIIRSRVSQVPSPKDSPQTVEGRNGKTGSPQRVEKISTDKEI